MAAQHALILFWLQYIHCDCQCVDNEREKKGEKQVEECKVML